MLVVYGHLLSGHSYKARLYCVLAGVPHEYRFTDITAPRQDSGQGYTRHSSEEPA